MSLSIRSVSKKVNGKTKRLWRWAYFGVDGKPKFITGKTKSVVEVLAKKKVEERTWEVKLGEESWSEYNRLK